MSSTVALTRPETPRARVTATPTPPSTVTRHGTATGAGRPRRLAALGAALLVTTLLCAACNINWQVNRNFGTAIEPGAVRASINIYRVPRKLLYVVYQEKGIRPVQDLIYASGTGPLTKISGFCVANVCLQSGFLRSVFHGLVYDRPGDLSTALVDAQRNLDCLALTLISYGAYEPNWTHKSVGCQIGDL